MKSALIGRQLGDYTLTRVLATGGMSRIYEGLDKRLNRRAAIKVLDMEADPNDVAAMRTRFEREARALAKLEHPNIVPIYQFGEQDGLYFIAMKLIGGGDLAGELKEMRRLNQTMTPVRAIPILEQIADALDTAHAAQIIHRDVKPSNILVDLNDRATLTDFGLVIEPSIDSTFGTAFGTPRYISPEQAADSSQAVPQSDIYSLAIVVYEMLTGVTPFDGRSPMEIAIAHMQDAPPPPRERNALIPQAVEQAILKALAKDPRERYPTAGAFVSALRAGYRDAGLLLDDTAALERTTALPGLAAVKRTTGSAPAAPPRRSLWPVIAGIALVLAGAVGGLILLTNGRAAPVSDPTASPSPDAPALVAVTAEAVPDESVTAPTATLPSTETPTPDPTATPVPLTGLLVLYDVSALTLVNTTGEAIDLSGFSLTPIDSTDPLFQGGQVTGAALPAGACYRIRAQDRRVDLPRECGGRLHGEFAPRDAAALFWVNDGFLVRAGGIPVRQCASARDGGGCT